MTPAIPAPQVRVGYASAPAGRPVNEDFVGYCIAEGPDAVRRGHVVAIADGTGAPTGGRTAAEMAVHGLLDAYYSLPEAHGPQRSAARAVETINGWLHGQRRGDPELAGAATTLTTLVIHGREAHIVHVGDTRALHFSEGRLLQLTEDHAHPSTGQAVVLLRAVGPEPSVRLDHARLPLRARDRFLLCSRGVHATLGAAQLATLLDRHAAPAEDAQRIVAAALAAGATDNATAIVVDIVALPGASPAEVSAAIAALPLAAPPAVGATIDGFLIEERIAEGRYTDVHAAVDRRSGRRVAIKFPRPAAASSHTHRLAFARETWVAGSVRDPHLAECVELPAERRTCLYSVMPLYEGETLLERIQRPEPVTLEEGLRIGVGLARAVGALHAAGVIHRDVQPGNVLLERGGGLRLLDLGVAGLAGLEEFPDADRPGTPAHRAPELWRGEVASEASDQFALGVTLYRMFSRCHPFAEAESGVAPRFEPVAPLSRYRPDLPPALDEAVHRCLARDARRRFADVQELVRALEAVAVPAPAVPARRRSLYERNPLLFWKVACAVLLVALVLSLAR
ncbi:MAG: bifunctional protein-serine/threonine kinase/phosphatase [Proteobacteria bacterium]|nr:bifunctional protein-serine/threonine kinase/phosphatase [Pseudomonadota bacterium]